MAGSIFIPDVVEETELGITGTNPTRATLPVLVAPTTEARKDAHNLIRQELVVVACSSFGEPNFQFDSSFLGPRSREKFIATAKLLRRHPGSPMTLFGHADPVGPRHYNHDLSERRARAVFGVLVRDGKIWEKLFSSRAVASGDVWGDRAIDTILDTLLIPRAIARTNSAEGRIALFEQYMDFLRGKPELQPPFPELTPNDFLGRGKEKATLQGCSAFNPQLILSREEHDRFAKDPALEESRNAANEPNRRVLAYLFAAGTVIDPAKWPCPLIADGTGESKCLERQWSDGELRRDGKFRDHRRRFGREVRPERRVLVPERPAQDALGKEERTFGCRFYHGIAVHSPCERDFKLWGLRIMVDAPTIVTDEGRKVSNEKVPLQNRRFVATIGTTPDAPVVRGRTTDGGIVALPLFDRNVSIDLRVDAFDALAPTPPPTPPGEERTAPETDSERFDDEHLFLRIRLDGGALKRIVRRDENSPFFDPDFDDELPDPSPADRRIAALQRLHNLGYGNDDTGGPTFANWDGADRRRAMEQFQRDNDLEETGVLDEPSADALFREHGS